MLCYSNDGLSMRHVRDDHAAAKGEALFAERPTADELAKAFPNHAAAAARHSAAAQVAALEAKLTPRLLMSAILGADGGQLKTLAAQIAAIEAPPAARAKGGK